jgi:ABC-type transport system involved in multi-copper enzyme maturation permease subunit
MALHELWISFRLIPLIGLPLIGGMLVSAVPPEFAGETAVGGAGFWYSVAAGTVICLAAGLAALTMAHERHRGTAAWMAVRAVPRSAVLVSWFLAFAILLIAGLAVGSVGAWLAATTRAESTPDAIPFAAAVAATAGTGLAGVAAGLLIGALLPTWPATVLAIALSAGLVVATMVSPDAAIASPTGGVALLSHLDSFGRPLAAAFQSAGAALAAAAVLLVLAGVGLQRSDL